jgi:hypothetical protein
VARAVAVFDQQGCVSPHLVYVEEGGDVAPADFAAMVGDALAALDAELPRGEIPARDASAVRGARDEAELAELAGHPVRLFPTDSARCAVIFDAQPRLRPSCLNRVLRVHPVPGLEAVADLVRPHRAVLQTAAHAGAGDRLPALAEALASAGVTRITAFADAPWPPVHGHHDGQEPLRELLRWVDLDDV